MTRTGFFGPQGCYARLGANKDPLVDFDSSVPRNAFRLTRERV